MYCSLSQSATEIDSISRLVCGRAILIFIKKVDAKIKDGRLYHHPVQNNIELALLPSGDLYGTMALNACVMFIHAWYDYNGNPTACSPVLTRGCTT